MTNQTILFPLVETYLRLVEDVYKKKEYEKISFSKGYYWSEIDEMQKIEKRFIKHLSVHLNETIKALETEKSTINKTYILHLLGWSKEYKKTPKVLTSFFIYKDVSVVNAAARSLFPMIAGKKTKLPIEETIKLLKRRNKYFKNKALGILAFSTDSDMRVVKKLITRNYIVKLTLSDEPMVSSPAKMLLDRFDS